MTDDDSEPEEEEEEASVADEKRTVEDVDHEHPHTGETFDRTGVHGRGKEHPDAMNESTDVTNESTDAADEESEEDTAEAESTMDASADDENAS